MRHPEFLIAPGLMLADYYLTLLGATLYGKTVEARAAYELNPRFRDDVGRLRLFHPVHLAAAAASAVMLYFAAEAGEAFGRFTFGLVVGVFGLIVGTHLANIVGMVAARADKERASGARGSSYRFKLTAAAAQNFGLGAAPASLFAALEPSPFRLGLAAGAWFLTATPILWRFRASGEDLARTSRPPVAGRCSFCGAGADKAKRLIAGEDAMICDECVETSVEALAEDQAATLRAGEAPRSALANAAPVFGLRATPV